VQPELSQRQRTILKLIVQEYIRTGRAVGSKSLIERYDLGISPATVRSEMGELEEQEYLAHPHTSAGRVPTDRGYRYYVEYLLDDARLPIPEQITISHQFRQVEAQIESWAKLAAVVLADMSGNLSLVTPPRSSVERMRHFELISLRGRVVLLVAVTQTGMVREVILQLQDEVSQEELSALSQRLNPEIRDLTHEQIRRLAPGASGLASFILEQLADLLRLTEQEAQTEVFAEGLDYVLQQPEIEGGPIAQRLLELLRGGAILSLLLPQLQPGDDVQVIIGKEHRAADLHPFAVVAASYGARNQVAGLLGVVGPTRMPYGRSISIVRYIAQVMTNLLRDIYDEAEDED